MTARSYKNLIFFLAFVAVVGDRHRNLSALHRAGRLHQQALCRLAQPALVPRGYVVVHPLFSAIKVMIISIVYMFVTLRSHVHMSDVTNILIIFFWIKLVLKLPNFQTAVSILWIDPACYKLYIIKSLVVRDTYCCATSH